MNEETEKTKKIYIKIVILGDRYVGKTSLLKQLIFYWTEDISNRISYKLMPLNMHKLLILEKDRMKHFGFFLDFTEYAYFSLDDIFRKNINASSVILLVYDVTNRKSFSNLNEWITLVEKNLDTNKVMICILGNKIDLKDNRVVDYSEGKEISRKSPSRYFFEVSCKENIGIDVVVSFTENYLDKLADG